VVMAHLKAQESKDGATRKGWKLRLVRLLYQRGYAREDILELFRVLDWFLQLPSDLEQAFTDELIAYEEQANMPYITGIERLGRQEGRKEGRKEGLATMLVGQLTLKFRPLDETQRQRIQKADPDTLLEWSTRVLNAATLNDIFATDNGADAPH
jgi:hypothetical protein